MIPISFLGGQLAPNKRMDGSTTQNPNASRKPPCWMAACPMPRSWRFGKNQGKGVSGNFCPSKKWWETRANTVGFRECIWCICIFETNIWGLSFAYEFWKVICMISMHPRLEVLNDWLTFLSTNRAIGQDKKDQLWSVKRCQFQEEGHLPSLGHFGGY